MRVDDKRPFRFSSLSDETSDAVTYKRAGVSISEWPNFATTPRTRMCTRVQLLQAPLILHIPRCFPRARPITEQQRRLVLGNITKKANGTFLRGFREKFLTNLLVNLHLAKKIRRERKRHVIPCTPFMRTYFKVWFCNAVLFLRDGNSRRSVILRSFRICIFTKW